MPPASPNPLVSIGYEGRAQDQLVDELRNAGVSVLVDVRLTPISRKPGLSKRRLEAALAGAGIRYVHAKSLGNPRDNRDAFRRGQQESVEAYRDLLADPASRQQLDHVAEFLEDGAVALLCFERDHASCHRNLVAAELRAQSPTLRLVKL